MTPENYVSAILQTPVAAFRGFVANDILALRKDLPIWPFGRDVANGAFSLVVPGGRRIDRICVSRLNNGATNATWYQVPGTQDSYVIAINDGLVETLQLLASDIFGYESEDQNAPLSIGGKAIEVAAPRVRSRIGAFLEMGYPLANEPPISTSDRRQALIDTLVADALRFAVLHELAHILLLHDKAPQAILRNRYTSTAIAVFSIEAEHQADELAIKLHAALRPANELKQSSMAFAGVALLFGVLALFERHQNYVQVFDTPHHHPPAYERLYRLRLALSTGRGYSYWSAKVEDGVRLARMDLEPNPLALEIGDAVSNAMLDVSRKISVTKELFSPMNALMNDFLNNPDEDKAMTSSCEKLAEWLFLGSPMKIMQHLAELLLNAPLVANTAADEKDYRRLRALVDLFTLKVRNISNAHLDVVSALQRFENMVESRPIS